MELPVQFVYTENGKQKSSIDENKRMNEIDQLNKDFQLTDASTGLKVKMKSSNIEEAKVDAENYLKVLWERAQKSYKRNLDMLN